MKVDFYGSLAIEKRLTFHIKSILNKDKNHYYCKIFLGSEIIKKNFYSIMMVKFGKPEIAKKKFYTVKKPVKIWDIYIDIIVISKYVITTTNSKHLIEYLDKDIRPLVSITQVV